MKIEEDIREEIAEAIKNEIREAIAELDWDTKLRLVLDIYDELKEEKKQLREEVERLRKEVDEWKGAYWAVKNRG